MGDGAVFVGPHSGRARGDLHPGARVSDGRVKVALRDDDTCYFTQPGLLHRVYCDVWDRVPVCLATVPFAIGYRRKGIPAEHWHSGEAFALERNPELMASLK